MNKTNTQEQIKNIVLTALFAAMIYVLTAFLKIPTATGYIHIGDSMIYLAAAILPMPYAMAAGAVGAGLSDYLSGYLIWVLPTMIIKALTAMCFTRKSEKIICVRNIIGIIGALVLCVGGYYLAGGILENNFISPLAEMPTNAIQALASAFLFVVLGFALDKMSFKTKVLGYRPVEKSRA
ncbi:MAG: TIGR04002 family protein [Acutalibacteraceae bacterium]